MDKNVNMNIFVCVYLYTTSNSQSCSTSKEVAKTELDSFPYLHKFCRVGLKKFGGLNSFASSSFVPTGAR